MNKTNKLILDDSTVWRCAEEIKQDSVTSFDISLLTKDYQRSLESLAELFEHLGHETSTKSFRITEDIYGVFLPAGSENISKERHDKKAVFDLFPSTSYTYRYYNELNFFDSFLANASWIEMESILDFNTLAIHALTKIGSVLIGEAEANRILPSNDNWLMRGIYYPAVASAKTLRLAGHVDDDLLAMVVSDDYSSLERLDTVGNWCNLNVEQGSAVIIAGGYLEKVSQGNIKGFPHRVVGGNHYQNQRYVYNINLGPTLTASQVYETYYKDIFASKYYLMKK